MTEKDFQDITTPAKLTARLVTAGSLEHSYLLDELKGNIDALISEAEPLVREISGFGSETTSRGRVLSRAEWAEANVDSVVVLMRPLLERVDRKVLRIPPSGVLRLAYRPLVGAQLGGVLGFLSHRVLGQYDVLREDEDVVWIVGVNLVAMERRFGFVPRDFRMWVLSHELTHRAQFAGHPWLREHFIGSVKGLVEAMPMDFPSLFSQIRRNLEERPDPPAGAPALGGEAGKRFEELQAFMSLIEGHANFVMDRVAREIIGSQERIRRTLRGGVINNPITKLLYKLLGLDIKRKQYEEGQRFLEAVASSAGSGAVSQCFESAESLPSLDEIRNPENWLRRVAA